MGEDSTLYGEGGGGGGGGGGVNFGPVTSSRTFWEPRGYLILSSAQASFAWPSVDVCLVVADIFYPLLRISRSLLNSFRYITGEASLVSILR